MSDTERIFSKCPALNALKDRPEPTAEHLRACLMELVRVIGRDERQAIDAATADLRRELDSECEHCQFSAATAVTQDGCVCCELMKARKEATDLRAENERLRSRLNCSTMPIPNMQDLADLRAENERLKSIAANLAVAVVHLNFCAVCAENMKDCERGVAALAAVDAYEAFINQPPTPSDEVTK